MRTPRLAGASLAVIAVTVVKNRVANGGPQGCNGSRGLHRGHCIPILIDGRDLSRDWDDIINDSILRRNLREMPSLLQEVFVPPPRDRDPMKTAFRIRKDQKVLPTPNRSITVGSPF